MFFKSQASKYRQCLFCNELKERFTLIFQHISNKFLPQPMLLLICKIFLSFIIICIVHAIIAFALFVFLDFSLFLLIPNPSFNLSTLRKDFDNDFHSNEHLLKTETKANETSSQAWNLENWSKYELKYRQNYLKYIEKNSQTIKNGKGIVFTAHKSKHLQTIFVALSFLNHLQSKYDVEIFLDNSPKYERGHSVIELSMKELKNKCQKLFNTDEILINEVTKKYPKENGNIFQFKVSCIEIDRYLLSFPFNTNMNKTNANTRNISNQISSPFASKLVAILQSTFEHILWLDYDNILLSNPDLFFKTSKMYAKYDAIFWPDYKDLSIVKLQMGPKCKNRCYTSADENSLIWNEYSLIYEPYNYQYFMSQESGQILINSKLYSKVLSYALIHCMFNRKIQSTMVYGDKDCFRILFLKQGAQFFMVPYMPMYVLSIANLQLKTHGIQFDERKQLTFIHGLKDVYDVSCDRYVCNCDQIIIVDKSDGGNVGSVDGGSDDGLFSLLYGMFAGIFNCDYFHFFIDSNDYFSLESVRNIKCKERQNYFGIGQYFGIQIGLFNNIISASALDSEFDSSSKISRFWRDSYFKSCGKLCECEMGTGDIIMDDVLVDGNSCDTYYFEHKEYIIMCILLIFAGAIVLVVGYCFAWWKLLYCVFYRARYSYERNGRKSFRAKQ